MPKRKIIACDFDGCLVEDRWPKIGLPIEKNIEALRDEIKNGALFILWTCRVGKELEDAIAFCRSFELYPDAVNDNPWQEEEMYGCPRKIFATEYWDDRAVCKSKDCTNVNVKSKGASYKIGTWLGFIFLTCAAICATSILIAFTVRFIQWLF